MMTALVLTVIGPDRPGLVESLSQALIAHDGNWEESRMASLAGQFAGILLVTAPEQRADALSDALRGLAGEGLRVEVAISGVEAPAPRRALSLELVGQDRHGIVRDIAHALAALNINIDELETEVSSASWSGEALFHAKASLRLPDDVADEELRAALEGLANELMVDITLDVPESA